MQEVMCIQKDIEHVKVWSHHLQTNVDEYCMGVETILGGYYHPKAREREREIRRWGGNCQRNGDLLNPRGLQELVHARAWKAPM